VYERIVKSALIEATPTVCYWTILSSFVAVALHFYGAGLSGWV
jgi:hypothetical protein